MNTGECVGGPLNGQQLSYDGHRFDCAHAWIRGSMVFYHTTYEWQPAWLAIDKVVIDKTGGRWVWEHYQGRDDLPADRN